MVADVAGAEDESAFLVPLLGGLERDLAVFHHLVFAIHTAVHAYWFCRVSFLNNLKMRKKV